jgi:hypothetical protein
MVHYSIFLCVSWYRVNQKHLTLLEIKQHFKPKWQNFINTGRYVLCHGEFMLIVTVWTWHTVSDHNVIRYNPAVTKERTSQHLVAFSYRPLAYTRKFAVWGRRYWRDMFLITHFWCSHKGSSLVPPKPVSRQVTCARKWKHLKSETRIAC